MKKISSLILLIVSLVISSEKVFADIIVENSQSRWYSGVQIPSNTPGQSFQEYDNGLLSEIDLYAGDNFQGGTATMTIFSGFGYNGPILGSQSQQFGGIGSQQPLVFNLSGLGIQLIAKKFE